MRGTRRPDYCSISVFVTSNEVVPSGDLRLLHLSHLDTISDLGLTSSWQEACLEVEEWEHY